MDRDLRVMILTHHGGGLDTNGPVAEDSALVIHANNANVFSHQIHPPVSVSTRCPIQDERDQ